MITVRSLAAIADGKPQQYVIAGDEAAAMNFCGGAPGQNVLVVETGTNAMAIAELLDFVTMPVDLAEAHNLAEIDVSKFPEAQSDQPVTLARFVYVCDLATAARGG